MMVIAYKSTLLLMFVWTPNYQNVFRVYLLARVVEMRRNALKINWVMPNEL